MAEVLRKTIPETIPIQCSAPSERPTISPARCRMGSSPGENTVGATTNAKKIRPPSQTTSASSIRKRRNAMAAIIDLPPKRLIHRPNQRCHLHAIMIEFTFNLPRTLAGGKIIRMTGSFAAADVNFLPLQLAVFCVECELLSGNNTPRCLACGSRAILSLSRVLGGSLRGQPTAHLIADAELNRLVRSLLHGIPPAPTTSEHELESPESVLSSRHHLRLREPGPATGHHRSGASGRHREINFGEIDLEPGISIIAEKAQALTGATGAAIALRKGSEIVCRGRSGRTAPDIGCRLQ